MALHKQHRVGVKLDMTPMVDVAFLLLTFFMLTTQFKPPEEVAVILAASHSALKLPESGVTTITISKGDSVFIGLNNPLLMAKVFGAENRLKGSIYIGDHTKLGEYVSNCVVSGNNRIVLKVDRDAPYGTVNDITGIVQKLGLNLFNLQTDLMR